MIYRWLNYNFYISISKVIQFTETYLQFRHSHKFSNTYQKQEDSLKNCSKITRKNGENTVDKITIYENMKITMIHDIHTQILKCKKLRKNVTKGKKDPFEQSESKEMAPMTAD